MYRELTVSRETTESIKIHSWWLLARDKPHLTKLIAGTISLLLGSQPRGIQVMYPMDAIYASYVKKRSRDDLKHVLFECTALDDCRRLSCPCS